MWKYKNSVSHTASYLKVIGETPNHEFLLGEISDEGVFGDTLHWFMDGEYLNTYAEGQTKAQAVAVYKADAKVGDSWVTNDPEHAGATETYKVIATNISHTTINGSSYNTTQVQTIYSATPNLINYSYWNNNVGEVDYFSSMPNVGSTSIINKNFFIFYCLEYQIPFHVLLN